MARSDSAHQARVHAVFQGCWPDRTPICEQAFASSVAGQILGREVCTGSTDVHYAEACAWLEGESAHEEFLDRLFEDTIALHRHFDFDVLYLPWRHGVRPTKRVDDDSILYGDPEGSDWEIRRFDSESRTYQVSRRGGPEPTLTSVVTTIRRELETSSPPETPLLDPLRERALREYGDEFVVAGGGGMAIPMEPAWLEATAVEGQLLGEYLDMVVERVLAGILVQYEAGMRLINGGGDFAFNSGPVYSPAFFREVMMPRWERIFDYCRDLGIYYVMRSDGNLWPVADDLFGAGKPAAYYEVDYDAGMHFDRLRQRFPELTLIGNVSCDLLRRGTAQQVSQRVRECIDAAAPRVIAASSNSILHGTPVDNVYALYETAKKHHPAGRPL